MPDDGPDELLALVAGDVPLLLDPTAVDCGGNPELPPLVGPVGKARLVLLLIGKGG